MKTLFCSEEMSSKCARPDLAQVSNDSSVEAGEGFEVEDEQVEGQREEM